MYVVLVCTIDQFLSPPVIDPIILYGLRPKTADLSASLLTKKVVNASMLQREHRLVRRFSGALTMQSEHEVNA